MKNFRIRNTPMKILLESLYFTYEGTTYKVPAGYAYDGLSIPQLFQNVVDMNETENEIAGIIHDYYYSAACPLIITRKQADYELFKDIVTLGRYLVYLGVRIGGWYSWKQDRNYKKYKSQIELARKGLNLKGVT